MRTDQVNKVIFIGIGGIGMSALARYFNYRGCKVYGYDKTPSALTQQLQAEGIDIFYEDDKKYVRDETDLAIYTPAIPQTSKVLECVRKSHIPLFKRAAILGQLSKEYKCIAVAGTHGKTSITGLLAHIFKTANIPVLAFIGGISTDHNTNIIYHKEAKYIIVEADEYDRSFLQLHPYISLVSAIAPDHLDIYGDFNALVDAFNIFISQTAPSGKVIVNQSLLTLCTTDISYGLSSGSSYFASDICIKNHKYYYSITTPEIQIKVRSNVPGRHNAENAVAAAAAACEAGVSIQNIKKGIESYNGIHRRFEILVNNNRNVFIDDYAHHPEELAVSIGTIKELYPDKKITGVFQPHLFTRTAHHAAAFAKELSKLDECILLDIYPAREEPIEGVTSKTILEKIKNTKASIIEYDELADYIKVLNPEVLVTLGAGDIDKLVPKIKDTLIK